MFHQRPRQVKGVVIRKGECVLAQMITGIAELDTAIERVNTARDRDEYHRLLCELAPIAAKHVDLVSARFDDDNFPRFNITWALIGNCDDSAIEVFCRAIKDQDKFVRWAASEALAKCDKPRAVSALVDGLKDRSTLVKGVAVAVMKRLAPQSATVQLRKIVQSRHLQTHSPGIVADASIALNRIENSG